MTSWADWTYPVTQQHLFERYVAQDYWWYLRSEEFRSQLLAPMGEIASRCQDACLDVACGEGQLAEFVRVPYYGIELSTDALRNAQTGPNRKFMAVNAAEFPFLPPDKLKTFLDRKLGTIVFSNVFTGVVRPEYQIDFLEAYLAFEPKLVIVCDLENLDQTGLDARLTLQREIHRTFQNPLTPPREILPEVKLHRKILVYTP